MLDSRRPHPDLMLEAYIHCIERTIRFNIVLCVGLAVFGLVVVVVGLATPGEVLDKKLPVLAGICLTTFSALPFKEVRSRKEKIELLRACVSPDVSEEDRTRVHDLVWGAIQKTIGG